MLSQNQTVLTVKNVEPNSFPPTTFSPWKCAYQLKSYKAGSCPIYLATARLLY